MKNIKGFEQGPIRPPSEAYSLLLRITRNCSWNKCEFCHTYKNTKFSRRPLNDILNEINTINEIKDRIISLSMENGYAGKVPLPFIRQVYAGNFTGAEKSICAWLYAGAKSVFLQDANSIMLPKDELVTILNFVREKFPGVERITTYGRSKTIAKKKSFEDLKELKEAGLNRIHIGFESGSDAVLKLINKGTTAKDHIDAGKKIKAASIELSEYYMPGLGGCRLLKDHALESARVLSEINPDFIRLRTLVVLPMMSLFKKVESGEMKLASEVEVIEEIRLFIENLNECTGRIVSDHVLNLLPELEGPLTDKKRLIDILDRFLALDEHARQHFRLGKRAGAYERLDDMNDAETYKKVETALQNVLSSGPSALDNAIYEIANNFI